MLTHRNVPLRGNVHLQECSFKGAWSTYRNVSGQPPKKRSRHLGKNLTSSRAAGGAGERTGGNEGGQTRCLSPSRVATLIPRSLESQSADLSDRQWWYPSRQLYAVHSSCTLVGLSTECSLDIFIYIRPHTRWNPKRPHLEVPLAPCQPVAGRGRERGSLHVARVLHQVPAVALPQLLPEHLFDCPGGQASGGDKAAGNAGICHALKLLDGVLPAREGGEEGGTWALM